MFIEQAFKSLHEWWRYIIGMIIVFVAVQIGSIPFVAAVLYKKFQEGEGFEALGDQSELMTVLDSNLTLFLMLLGFVAGLVALLIVIKFLHKQPLIEATTARKKIDWGRFWFGFGLIGVTITLVTGIDYYANPESYVLQFQLVPFLILLLIAAVLLPLQTSMEEYLFRGYLMQGIGVSTVRSNFPFIILYFAFSAIIYFNVTVFFELGLLLKITLITTLIVLFFILLYSGFVKKIKTFNIYNKLYLLLNRSFTPLIITSITFGLLHMANPEVEKMGSIIMVYYIGTGLLLGIMTLMDDGMELALGFHAGNNIIAALLVTADWTVFQTNSVLKDISEPSAGLDIVMPVLIMYPIFIGILAWKYKWTNWKEKLFGKVTQPITVTAEVHDESIDKMI